MITASTTRFKTKKIVGSLNGYLLANVTDRRLTYLIESFDNFQHVVVALSILLIFVYIFLNLFVNRIVYRHVYIEKLHFEVEL